MNVYIVLLSFVLVCQAISDDQILEKWKNFQVNYEKTYKSPLEYRRRLNIFRENLAKIEAHNALYKNGSKSYELGVNQFADWTSEEFMQYVNKYDIPSVPTELLATANLTAIPDSIDWREKNAVTEVKNQGQCGSCWAFSTVGSIEGQLAIKKKTLISLSEQNLIDCAGSVYNCFGCDGGTVSGAMLYVAQNSLTTTQNYPYTGKAGKCKQSLTPSFKISYYGQIISNEANLKVTVGNTGPVTVAIEATSNLQLYKSGIFFDPTCSGRLNHGVLVVGYGEENGVAYWIVKNSWGAAWGERGYFRLERNHGNNCGIALRAVIPTL